MQNELNRSTTKYLRRGICPVWYTHSSAPSRAPFMDDDTLPSHIAEGSLSSPPASDTRRSPNGHASVPLNESPMYTLEGGEEPADGWCVQPAQVTLCISCLLHTPSHSLLCPHHSDTHTRTQAHPVCGSRRWRRAVRGGQRRGRPFTPAESFVAKTASARGDSRGKG